MELRLGPPVLWQPIKWSNTKVRLSDDARACVVFMGFAPPGGRDEDFDPGATGFLVHGGREAPNTVYLVTAAHCVTGGLDGPFAVRVGSTLVRIEDPDWTLHDDPAVDVAVMPFVAPRRLGGALPRHTLLTSARLGVGDFGPGDQTYTVGLFSYHSGKSRNIPLVHVGHIAAVPASDEDIEVKGWRGESKDAYIGIQAYVVQCAAFPGSSGSPVFVRKPIQAADMRHKHADHGYIEAPDAMDAMSRVPPMAYGATFLLGLWHGSWDLKKSRLVNGSVVRDPAGYGIVVPAQKILEVLEMPKLKEQAQKDVKANKDAKAPEHDSALVQKQRFEKTVRKMLDTPPQPKHTNPDKKAGKS